MIDVRVSAQDLTRVRFASYDFSFYGGSEVTPRPDSRRRTCSPTTLGSTRPLHRRLATEVAVPLVSR
jgi:hypothetical protein